MPAGSPPAPGSAKHLLNPPLLCHRLAAHSGEERSTEMKGLIHKTNAQLIPGWHRALSAAAAAEGGSQQPGMGHRERARLRAQLADPATDS